MGERTSNDQQMGLLGSSPRYRLGDFTHPRVGKDNAGQGHPMLVSSCLRRGRVDIGVKLPAGHSMFAGPVALLWGARSSSCRGKRSSHISCGARILLRWMSACPMFVVGMAL